MLQDPQLLRVAAALLNHANAARPFADSLLAFLVHRQLHSLAMPRTPVRSP